ncbi:MAG: alkaline phosphatase family protein, partial [bacterium]
IGPACSSDSMKEDFPEIHTFPEVGGWDAPDAWVMGNAITVLEKKDPDFLFLHLGFIDPAQHNFGHGSAEAWAAVEWADHLVGTLIDYLKKSGKLRTTLMVLTADHGQSNLWKDVEVRQVLEDAEIPVKFVHPGVMSYVFLENPADTARAVEVLKAHPGIDGVWSGDEIDDIHLRTPFTGDIVVSTGPPHSGSVYRSAFDLKFRDISVGAHGGLAQRFVPLVFTGPGIRRGVILDNEADASLVDITPTIAALTGFPAPDDVQGKVLPVSKPVLLEGRVVGASRVFGPDLTPHLLDEQPRKCSLMVIVFCIISLVCLLAICMTKGPEKRYGFPQSLLAVVAIALATNAALFMQFIELYGSIPGIWPDSYLFVKWPRVYGTPVVAHTLVQFASWACMWLFYGSILCVLGKILTKSPTGCHLKAFPSYMTPLAWTLLALTVYYRLYDVDFYNVRQLFTVVYLIGLGLSFIKVYVNVKKIEGAPVGGSLLATGVVAGIYLAGIWLIFKVPLLVFVLGTVTTYPVGTH